MSNKTITLRDIGDNETIRLICREVDSLTVELNSDLIQKPIENENQPRQSNGSLFLFKLQESNIESPQQIVYIVSEYHQKIPNQITCCKF